MLLSAIEKTHLPEQTYPYGSKSTLNAPWKIHDRIHHFLIENKILLWRPLAESKMGWNVIKLPGEAVPFEVKADWENLMVLDTSGAVHYAKSCEEDKSLMENLVWFKGIWNFPVISELYNAFVLRTKIQVDSGGLWACSFIENNSFYIDGAGKEHELGKEERQIGSTTTAYVADEQKRVFRFYDPYLPPGPEDAEKIFFPFPETANRYFELKGFASCRSGLFCVGYDVTNRQEGGVNKNLAGYFISADANLLGLNPWISYTYQSKPSHPTDFILPSSIYQSIELPNEGEITGTLGVARAQGKSMTDVLLTIEGKRQRFNQASGKSLVESGYYFKELKAQKWQFHSSKKHQVDSQKVLVKSLIDPSAAFQPNVFDLKGHSYDRKYHATLHDFGTHSLVSRITLHDEGGKSLEIKLYPKENIWDILGFDWVDFTLVVAQETREILGWEEAIPVSIKQDAKVLTLIKERGSEILFEFQLQQSVKEEKKVMCTLF